MNFFLEYHELLEREKAASGSGSNNNVHKCLKLDQSGNSGEPLEQLDPPHYSSNDPSDRK